MPATTRPPKTADLPVGLVRPQRLGEVEIGALDEVLRVNLHPALKAVQAILPGMKARGWGGS